MPSDNEKSANSGGFGTGLDETPTDEDSVASLGEGLVASDGSHLGSISAHSLDPESIGDPPEDEFIDQGHQEGVGGGGNLADETIDLGLEFGGEERIVGNGVGRAAEAARQQRNDGGQRGGGVASARVAASALRRR
jgi:hypothetical protein